MPINIKNPEVTRKANKLAQTTGETITEAVGKAIDERLDRLQKQASRKGIAEKAMAIGRDFASRASKEWRTWDYDAELYDDQGLPK